jgi:hypothetical protein
MICTGNSIDTRGTNDPAEADYGICKALHEHLLRHCDTEEAFMLQENSLRAPHVHEHCWIPSRCRRKFDASATSMRAPLVQPDELVCDHARSRMELLPLKGQVA